MAWAWLDTVPGARSAYNYVRVRLDKFQEVGAGLRGQLAELDRWSDLFPSPPQGNQAAVWSDWVALRSSLLAQLDRWDKLNVVINPIWQAVLDVGADREPVTLPSGEPPSGGLSASVSMGLGLVPWPVVIRVAGWLIALGVTLNEFFAWQSSHESTIETFVAQAVAAGAMSPSQAADVLREGSSPSTVGSLTQLATLGIIALVVMTVLQGQRKLT